MLDCLQKQFQLRVANFQLVGGALLFALVWFWSLIRNRLGAAWGHLSINYALASGAYGTCDRTHACINNAYNICTTTTIYVHM